MIVIQYSGKNRKNGKRSVFHSLIEYVLRTINVLDIDLGAEGQRAIMDSTANSSWDTQLRRGKYALMTCPFTIA